MNVINFLKIFVMSREIASYKMKHFLQIYERQKNQKVWTTSTIKFKTL